MCNRIEMLFVTVIIVLVGLSTSDPFSRKEIAKPRADDTVYRLKNDVIPKEYTLKLTPNFDRKTFTGKVEILLEVKADTPNITLHYRDLTIQARTIKITNVNTTKSVPIQGSGPSGTPLQEFFLITTKENLEKGNFYNLEIPKFDGVLDGLRGFYYAEYKEGKVLRKFATTHFEPTGARQAFPCFDEPKFKAKFKIYITRPDTYNSVSNMKLVNKRSSYATRTVEDEFESSVLMPTYLVAFIVSEMKLTNKTENNAMETLASQSDIDQGYADYSVDAGNEILKSIENFVNVNYTLDKMYQASIPDNYFTPGAMENWGLVTYRKSYLLVTKDTTTMMKQQTDTIIAHEFAHQWFGNLATQEWWQYLWLSEGFATYFQYRAVDNIKPEWKLMEQFVVKVTQLTFVPDSLSTTRSMNQNAGSPAEISALFDRIAYEKSAAVIRMLEAILTLNVFRAGLTNYLMDRQYNWAKPSMLYDSFDSALNSSSENLPNGLTIKGIMESWESQEGYPLITVKRNYDKNYGIVQLEQKRFILNSSQKKIWTVPINYATRGQPNFHNLRASAWLIKKSDKILVETLNSDDWLILNKQEAYYYRVNYDEKNWNLLIDALWTDHSKINVLNRAQIIDDAFNIAKFNLLNYAIPLNISLYLENEIEYAPFQSFFNALTFLKDMISGTLVEKNFQKYILNTLTPIYEHLGFYNKKNDSHTDILTRSLVIHHLCNFNHTECRNKALYAFKTWQTGSILPPDLESSILCGAMRTAESEDWQYLYNSYLKSKNSAEIGNQRFQSFALSALGCSEDSTILNKFLDSTMPANSNQEMHFNDAILIITNGGPIGVQIAFDYVSERCMALFIIYGDQLATAIRNIGSKLTTDKQLQTLEALGKKHNLTTIFAEGISKATENVKWNKNRLKEINQWLSTLDTGDSGHGGSDALSPLNIFSVIILFSVMIKIF